MVCDVPGASVPSAHGKAVVQAPLLDTKVRPAGVGAFTTTLVAAGAPLLLPTIAETAGLPGTPLTGPRLGTPRSALRGGAPGSVARVGVGSATPDGFRALAVLASVPVASGETVPWRTKVAVAPTGRFTATSIAPLPLG